MKCEDCKWRELETRMCQKDPANPKEITQPDAYCGEFEEKDK